MREKMTHTHTHTHATHVHDLKSVENLVSLYEGLKSNQVTRLSQPQVRSALLVTLIQRLNSKKWEAKH